MSYSADSFTALEVPTLAKMNKLWSNDASFNDGTGIADNAIIARHITANIITSGKIDWAASTGKIWWEELARVTWSSGSSLDTGTIPAKKYLKIILVYTDNSSASGVDLQFNGDTGANYTHRRYLNGSETTVTSENSVEIAGNYKGASISEVTILNQASVPKPIWGYWSAMPTAGASNSPSLGMYSGRWVNSASQITRVKANHRGTNFATGSELIVLGHD